MGECSVMADLLSVLHDIDRIQGRICGECRFASWKRFGKRRFEIDCSKGMVPADQNDGCEKWRPRKEQKVA